MDRTARTIESLWTDARIASGGICCEFWAIPRLLTICLARRFGGRAPVGPLPGQGEPRGLAVWNRAQSGPASSALVEKAARGAPG